MAFWLSLYWVIAAIMVYIYFGYSLLLALLSGLVRRSPNPSEVDLPAVSLIIPAHNEERILEAKLNNALSLDYPADKLEVLVASDGSIDRTKSIGESFADRGVRLLAFSPRRGKASAVNDAVVEANAAVLCLCDANVMFRPDALRLLVHRLVDPRIGAATGDVRLASHESNFGQGESLYYRIEKRLQVAESSVGSLMGVDGGMYVLRKPLFQPLPADTILDDFVISMRVIQQGFRVVYEPAAVADENGTPLASQEFRRRVRVAAGAVQTIKRGDRPPLSRPVELWQFVSHKLLRWLGPLWLILLLTANVASWPTHSFYRATLVAQLAFYLAALAGCLSLRLRAMKLGGIPFYFVLSHVAMVVGTVTGLFNRQKVTWQQAERTGSLAANPSSHAH